MFNPAHTIWALFTVDQIPFWLKVSATLFVCLVVPVYWMQYGPGNFLWFSDIALLLTVPALWLESALLASMMILAVGLLEILWILDFFIRLITGISITGLSGYMFDPKIPLAVRALSLFHLPLPVVLFWMISRLGYDSRALLVQTLFSWIVLPLCYWLTDRSENVNWVYGFGKKPHSLIPAPLHLAVMMALFPLVIYLPSHYLLRALFD